MPTCFPSVATSPFCGAPWTWWKLLRIARSRRGVVLARAEEEVEEAGLGRRDEEQDRKNHHDDSFHLSTFTVAKISMRLPTHRRVASPQEDTVEAKIYI